MVMQLSRIDAFGGADILDSRVRRFSFAPHWHDDYVFAAYYGGQKDLRCGPDQHVTQAGEVLIIAPGTVHSASVRGHQGWHYKAIYLDEGRLCRATGVPAAVLARQIRDHALIRRNGMAGTLAQALDAGGTAELAISEWLLAALTGLPCADPARISPPAGLRLVHERIMDDPAAPIRMADLTGLAGVSPAHLSRAFRASFGLSPFQMITAARLDRARRAIAAGARLADAAADAGFADQSHMNRWFRRTYGATPGWFQDRINSVQDPAAPRH